MKAQEEGEEARRTTLSPGRPTIRATHRRMAEAADVLSMALRSMEEGAPRTMRAAEAMAVLSMLRVDAVRCTKAGVATAAQSTPRARAVPSTRAEAAMVEEAMAARSTLKAGVVRRRAVAVAAATAVLSTLQKAGVVRSTEAVAGSTAHSAPMPLAAASTAARPARSIPLRTAAKMRGAADRAMVLGLVVTRAMEAKPPVMAARSHSSSSSTMARLLPTTTTTTVGALAMPRGRLRAVLAVNSMAVSLAVSSTAASLAVSSTEASLAGRSTARSLTRARRARGARTVRLRVRGRVQC